MILIRHEKITPKTTVF
jgi:hypothetical protein